MGIGLQGSVWVLPLGPHGYGMADLNIFHTFKNIGIFLQDLALGGNELRQYGALGAVVLVRLHGDYLFLDLDLFFCISQMVYLLMINLDLGGR